MRHYLFEQLREDIFMQGEQRRSVEFSVLEFSEADLSEMEEWEAAALALTSYIASEVRTMMRLYLASAHDFDDEFLVNLASISQRAVVLRIWSAKLYEFIDFVEKNNRQVSKLPKPLLDLIDKTAQRLKEVKSGQGWAIARAIRNETAFHYNLKAVKKNLRHLTSGVDLNFYINSQAANSMFPIGEEVVFNGRLHRSGHPGATVEQRGAILKEWHIWNVSVTREVFRLHQKMVKAYVHPKQQFAIPRKRSVSMANCKVKDFDSFRLPLFDDPGERSE
ncbi:hypothetical protein [uncultured Ruegeria sp.]|uniref:hypothetical protein n=1 Tax=uncultured Ruegeria sp. TaxID=259304 RepID=UPI0026198902|nr:hypothetical protein [uncultured Ruegeria sp.]